MDLLLLPDFFAMAILLGVLAAVRRRYSQHDISLWMSGLLLILLESVSRLLYGMRLPLPWHLLCHMVALNAYLIAGVLFLRSSVDRLRRLPRATLFLVVNTLPSIALLSAYGAHLQEDRLMPVMAVTGALTGVLTIVALRRSWPHLLAVLAVWLPTIGAGMAHLPRWMVYLHLAMLYLVVAASFAWSLPRRSSGKIAVVLGFAMWAMCFATHPWIAQYHPQWTALASQVWNMQKFLITVGFLLVLFEKQVDSNEWMALHDQLTGLPNRRLFEDRINNAVARAERDRTAIILFAMDLNNFKQVNDTLGHDAGDALLCSVGESLQNVVRKTDTLARLGGDEFTLLATDVKGAREPRRERRWRRNREDATEDGTQDAPLLTDAATVMHTSEHPVLRHARRIENDLRHAVDKPVLLPSTTQSVAVAVSVSIGIAVYPTDSTDLAELARIADRRMYEDKRRQKTEHAGLDRMLSLLGTG